jgi:hypothetical protein
MNQSSIQQIVTAITPLVHKIGQEGYSRTDWFGWIIAHILCAVLTVAFFGIIITNGVQPLINPVYQAIDNITGQLIPAPQGN